MPSPWINGVKRDSGIVWYWVREGPIDLQRRYATYSYGLTPQNPGISCANIKSTVPTEAVNLGIYVLRDAQNRTTRRLCHMGRTPVLDLGGDGSAVANAALSCRVLYDWYSYDHKSWSGLFTLYSGEQDGSGIVFEVQIPFILLFFLW